MKFGWLDKEFELNERNTSPGDGFLYVRSDEILHTFENHFYVVASELSLVINDDSGHSILCAKLDFSVRFVEDEEYLSDVVFLTDDEQRLLEDC